MGNAPEGWYTDPHDDSRQRYWSGTAWTDHVHAPVAEHARQPLLVGATQAARHTNDDTLVISTPAREGQRTPTSAASRTDRSSAAKPLWRRTWVLVTATAVVCLGIGGALGDQDADAAKASAQRSQSAVGAANERADRSRARADKAVAAANQAEADKVAAEMAADGRVKQARSEAANAAKQAKEDLRSQYDELAGDRSKLTSDQKAFDQKVSTYNADTIEGDGEFLVGKDVAPGVYHAEASPGCYWARLASLDTSDILDNNNVDGPLTIEVKASDAAIETSGCATFHKVG